MIELEDLPQTKLSLYVCGINRPIKSVATPRIRFELPDGTAMAHCATPLNCLFGLVSSIVYSIVMVQRWSIWGVNGPRMDHFGLVES